MIAMLAQDLPFFRTGNVLAWVLGAVLLLFVVLVLVLLKFINLWVQAYMSGTKIGLFQLVGMSRRKVNPTVIVRAGSRLVTTAALCGQTAPRCRASAVRTTLWIPCC